ncbi:hypothetical protein QR685DRAFT_536079 [Neurospora intermedia]|uniref:Uncharacterized protein n=1 Tax=Neurospora intermedia TaxID=5142 RepID=A0ABR3D0P5_NEUIN
METLPSAAEHSSGGLQASDASAQPLPAGWQGYRHRMNNDSTFNQAISDHFIDDHDRLMVEFSTPHDVDDEKSRLFREHASGRLRQPWLR